MQSLPNREGFMIILACDHAGYELKEQIKEFFNKENITTIDVGCYSTDSCDYPDFVKAGNAKVLENSNNVGIYICGTGIGMSIAANKVKGVRCGHCHDVFSAKMTRLHNNANVLALGERVVGPGLMVEIVDAFLNTPFSYDERHMRRVNKIIALEQENFK